MVARADFQAMAVRLFDTFGDLIDNATLSQPGAWNPVTETQTPTTEAGRIKVAPIDREEADGTNVMVGDLEAVLITAEWTATPAIDDTLLLSGVNYLVRGVTDVHGVIWRLHLRRV